MHKSKAAQLVGQIFALVCRYLKRGSKWVNGIVSQTQSKYNAKDKLTLLQPVVHREVPVNDHVHKRSWKLDGDWVCYEGREPALGTEKETKNLLYFFKISKVMENLNEGLTMFGMKRQQSQ